MSFYELLAFPTVEGKTSWPLHVWHFVATASGFIVMKMSIHDVHALQIIFQKKEVFVMYRTLPQFKQPDECIFLLQAVGVREKKSLCPSRIREANATRALSIGN